MTKKKDDFLDRLFDSVEKKLEKVDLKELGRFVMEEGLYIALMTDLYLVSGRVKVWQDEPSRTIHTPLAAQRIIMTDMVVALTDMAWQEIPLTDSKPLGWAHPLFASWGVALSTAEDVGGVVYYTALPAHMRMFMVLGLPGMLRIAVQLTRQLIQIAT